MKLEILTIGGEILNGRTLDTNFHYLARQLMRLGVPPLWHGTVPDRRELLLPALKTALARAEGIIVTGGLGGTPDDITRQALAQALGRRLVLREDVRQEIERIFRERGRIPPPSADGLTLVPQGAETFPNPVGLAPGILLPTPAGGFLIALPGVPEEMRALVNASCFRSSSDDWASPAAGS
jgi:nicotinamide-nucleotide amidase